MAMRVDHHQLASAQTGVHQIGEIAPAIGGIDQQRLFFAQQQERIQRFAVMNDESVRIEPPDAVGFIVLQMDNRVFGHMQASLFLFDSRICCFHLSISAFSRQMNVSSYGSFTTGYTLKGSS